jgi:hypothetical protein
VPQDRLLWNATLETLPERLGDLAQIDVRAGLRGQPRRLAVANLMTAEKPHANEQDRDENQEEPEAASQE